VLASLGYALGGFVIKRRLQGTQPIGLVTATMLFSAALALPAALATAPSSAPGIGPVAAVAALGVLGTGIAFWIYYSLIAYVGPARTALVAYIAPGFAVAYGVILLDESFTIGTAAGLVLILVGSWLAAEGLRLPWRAPRAAAAPASA
jgi:drug/metabolite transporter (DMT)-like permease